MDSEKQFWTHRVWSSDDGTRLHARDWPGNADRPPILCLPGLTRNARDFDALARAVSPQWRMIAADLRGRGESGHAKDAASYVPATYVRDVVALLDDLAIERCIVVGTSLGGIVAMLLAAAAPGRIVGAILNDVGPEIEPAGLARIRGHVGKASVFPTWMHAARAVAEAYRDIHPDYAIEDWLAMAKRLYRLNSGGRIVLDYDPRIAEPLRTAPAEPAPDLWGALAALNPAPVLVVRGERSDILSARVAQRMVAALDDAELVTVPRTGHAPTLDESVLRAPIDRLLMRVTGG